MRCHTQLLLITCVFPASLFGPEGDSDSESSVHSNPSCRSEKTLSEKLEILTNQGLIQVVKVFVDWLRTNTDIIVMCAQVGEPCQFCHLFQSEFGCSFGSILLSSSY